MGEAWVRTVTVNGQRYVQAVVTQPGGSVKILQSFGQYGSESWLKAQQFVASYNRLLELRGERRSQAFGANELLTAGLAIFGIILGAKIVQELLAEEHN